MLNLQSIESAIGLITIIMAYFFVVTMSGVFRAWVASMMGDDTPARLGFMKFNSLAHTDFIGFLFLLLFRFGWGRYIPINPLNIQGRFRALKLLVAYLSDTFANIIMAIITLTVLIANFGTNVLRISIPMMLTDSLILQNTFSNMYSDCSSLSISIALIGTSFIYLNVWLAVLNFIISGFGYLSMVFMESLSRYGSYKDTLLILIPMFIIFFFINPLRYFVVYGIANIGYIISYILGIG